jgi:acetylornithine deacetylase/succinyl-diaminopimelate desuccinylase-like protein
VSELSELAKQLVSIDSINPELIPGAAGEAEIANFVAHWLKDAGLEVEVEEVAPGRPNVVGIARGTGGGRTLLLNAHMDTVGVAGMDRPHEPYVQGGRLYGRGAYDMKTSLAAIMLAGAQAVRRRFRGDVVVTAVVDEEVASIGTEAIARRYRADGAVVAEPTQMRVAVAHRGFVAFEIETKGRAAHGSRPDLGVDAIAHMGHVLVRLEELDRRLRANASHTLLASGSLHASVIEGGQEYSSYPERCVLQAERRTVPGETTEHVEGEIHALLGDVDGQTRVVLARTPFEVDQEEAIVELVRRHAGDGEVVGVPFWADSAVLAGAGIPTVLFGPSGEGAHAVVEWVDLAAAERCLEVYLAVAADLCG